MSFYLTINTQLAKGICLSAEKLGANLIYFIGLAPRFTRLNHHATGGQVWGKSMILMYIFNRFNGL